MNAEKDMMMPALTPENIAPVDRDARATGRYLIAPSIQDEETSEGLVQSEGDGHSTPVYGRILKATSTAKFKVGDNVLFRRYAIDTLKTYTAEGDKEVYLLDEQEIIGIVRDSVDPPQRQSNTAQISELKNNGKEKETSQKGESQEG